MRASMLRLTSVHQIVAPIAFSRAIASGAGCPCEFGPVERTAQRGLATLRSSSTEPYLEPWWALEGRLDVLQLELTGVRDDDLAADLQDDTVALADVNEDDLRWFRRCLNGELTCGRRSGKQYRHGKDRCDPASELGGHKRIIAQIGANT